MSTEDQITDMEDEGGQLDSEELRDGIPDTETEDESEVVEREPVTHYGEVNVTLGAETNGQQESAEEEAEAEATEVMTEVYVPEWPISIALVGAPDSNKAAILDAFVEKSADLFSDADQNLAVLENAGNLIEEEFDQAMGPYGGFREDVWAFYKGLEQELRVRNENRSFIRNGTILENMAHAGANLEVIMTGVMTSDAEQRAHQVQMAMTHLTYLYFSEFRYKFVFYSPQMEKIILPGQDDYRSFNQRVDAALRQIIINFGLQIQMLKGETVEERAEEMNETIRKIMTEGIEIPGDVAAAIASA